MRRRQNILGVDERPATIETAVVQQLSHPRILVHLRLVAADNAYLLVGQTTFCKPITKLLFLTMRHI